LEISGYKFEPVETHSLVVELTKRLLDYIFSGTKCPLRAWPPSDGKGTNLRN